MPVQRVSAAEAFALMTSDGYVYVDVRSVPEFDAEHPKDAYNVPLREPVLGGLADNPDFVSVMQRLFQPGAKLVLGCAAGVRSLRACELLEEAGFTCVVDQRAGLDGVRDAFGRIREPGWSAAQLPTVQGADHERGYKALRERAESADAETLF
jgi:rhodanese-related sulfurtransferase